MSQLRVFLGNAMGDDAERCEHDRRRAIDLFGLYMPGVEVVVTLGKEDWDRNFASCRNRNPRDGGWSQWAREVGTAVNPYNVTEPRYHAMVVPREMVGKATAMIAVAFKQMSKPVYVLAERRLMLVTDAETVNAKNRASGWRLIPTELPLPGSAQG
jgi:hypothetical protein